MQGKISFSGCAVGSYSERYVSEFTIGQKVCVKSKALKGILEPIIIKLIKIEKPGDSYRGYGTYIVYKDTQNRLWPEAELVTIEQANGYINAYVFKLKKYLENLDACQRKNILPELILKFPSILD
jgi:hypothetical protein